MTIYVAKPNLNNNNNMKEFPTKKHAIKYLEEFTGYEMDDWELIGKLFPKRS